MHALTGNHATEQLDDHRRFPTDPTLTIRNTLCSSTVLAHKISHASFAPRATSPIQHTLTLPSPPFPSLPLPLPPSPPPRPASSPDSPCGAHPVVGTSSALRMPCSSSSTPSPGRRGPDHSSNADKPHTTSSRRTACLRRAACLIQGKGVPLPLQLGLGLSILNATITVTEWG